MDVIGKHTVNAMKVEIEKYIEKRLSDIKNFEKDLEDKFIRLPDKKFGNPGLKDILPFTVGGVDGGVAKETFIYFEVAIIRPAGVVLKYDWDKETSKPRCEKLKIYNKSGSELRLEKWGKDYDEISSILNFTCKRIIHEFNLAKKICESEKPDMLLLHGPLFPHYLKNSIQSQNSEAEDFQKLGNIISFLLDFQFSNNSFVCGIVEDSRGKTFIKSTTGCDKFSDIEVLSVLMPENTITFPVKHEGMENLKRISTDFEKIEDLSVFYYRPHVEDMPIRIEFVPKKDPIKESLKIAKMISVQLFPCKSYTMPWALVEADKLAKISEEESKILFKTLLPPLTKYFLLRRKKRMI